MLAAVAPDRAAITRLSPTVSDGSIHAVDTITTPLSVSQNAADSEAVPQIPVTSLDLGEDFSFHLPKCELPPAKDFAPVEAFVHKTVVEQNLQVNDNVPIKPYKGILDALRLKADLALVTKILLALRTSGNGSTLHLLASGASKHARLIHHLVRFNPFESKADKTNDNNTNDEEKSFAIADAHLHLLLALVSANSVYLLPTLSALWKMLALDFEDVSIHRYVQCDCES